MNRAEKAALEAIPTPRDYISAFTYKEELIAFKRGYYRAGRDILEWMEEHLGEIIGAGDKSEVISIFKRYMEEDQ